MREKNIELKPCPFCGGNPVIEHWSSGGLMYMVKCNNPDCQIPSCGYPKGHNLNEVKEEWNRRSDNGLSVRSPLGAWGNGWNTCIDEIIGGYGEWAKNYY